MSVDNSDWKNYIANGYCFYQAAKQLDTISFTSGQANLLKVAQNFVPATVNYAFAAELGLKAIIMKEKGEIKHIHELDKLYTELPDTASRFIISIVISNLFITEDEALTLIHAHAKTFADWRYFIFNQKKLSVNFKVLVKLCDAIYQYIKRELNQ